MELDARWDERHYDYKLFNKDTGKEITRCFWANDESGDYKTYLHNENGTILAMPSLIEVEGHGNIEFKRVNGD